MPRKPSLQVRLARRLRELRDEHGLSQMDMVRDYGWSLSHYQKLERGVLDPRITTLERLAEETYGLTLAELLDGV